MFVFITGSNKKQIPDSNTGQSTLVTGFSCSGSNSAKILRCITAIISEYYCICASLYGILVITKDAVKVIYC